MASGDKTMDLYKKGLGRAQNVGGGTESGFASRRRAQKKRAMEQLRRARPDKKK